MFFTFCICLSGLLFGYRTKLHEKIKFPLERKGRDRALTKIGTALFLFLGTGCLMPAKTILSMLIFSLLIAVISLSIRQIFRWRKKMKFERSFRLFLNQIILTMGSGKSFRQSFRESILYFESDLRKQFSEIFEIVTFSQQLAKFSGSPFEKRVLEKFIVIDKSPRNSLDQLKSFRVELELSEFFRRRSGQVTGAVRFQALLISILYFFLMAFVLIEFGWSGNRLSIGLSVGLFLVGLVFFYYLGRKRRWKL